MITREKKGGEGTGQSTRLGLRSVTRRMNQPPKKVVEIDKIEAQVKKKKITEHQHPDVQTYSGSVG